uniref:Putative regulator of g protein signaling n=1 Tax=Ornithodoros turicata TaxID=34597 RepID=A0A2R5LCN5_9ACAR
MHPTRRRKKRPSYGVRTVELSRGRKGGFGFTISGQAPCILSCIVAHSPAERAGLRPGDFLVAVNGHNISRAPHDDVVRLIGNSMGALKLQIAENYCSDSSEEEEAARPLRGRPHPARPPRDSGNKALLDLILQQKAARQAPPRPVLRTVVGYLGTIELPREVCGSRLQAIRSCVRRLRIEQKVHTLVVFSVLRDGVVLRDLRGTLLARFPSERITFSGAYADDSRFFGLVTRGADGALSCHVLMVDPRTTPRRGAPSLNVHDSAEPILRALAALYHRGAHVSPQPSQAGSHSSNSDSGIGFRDEGHASDCVLVVDVDSYPRFQSFSLDRQGALPCSPGARAHSDSELGDETHPASTFELSRDKWGDSTLLGDSTMTDERGGLDTESARDASTKGEDGSSSATPRRNVSSCSSSRNWTRTSSLRRRPRRSHYRSTHDAGAVSDGEIGSEKLSPSSSVQSLEQVSDSSSACDAPRGRVGSWVTGFDRLLYDPLGLLVFAEFLKKEFSQENIFFWVACEQYKKIQDVTERRTVAREIYQRHLAPGALEPVNVDARSQQGTQKGLEDADPDLFTIAQRHIFHLMKFDCYQRFLKSDLFKECLLREVQGQPIFPELPETTWKQPKEDKRRKSFLPWHKNLKLVSTKLGERSAAWARRSARKKKRPVELAGSQSSLASSEASLGMLCSQASSSLEDPVLSRVVLPDGSTTVVRARPGETLGATLTQLLQKRSLTYSAVDVFIAGSNKPINPNLDVTMVGSKEIRVEPRVVFCTMLPNSKTLGVKVAPGHTCADILCPILAKYSVQLEHVTLRMSQNCKALPSSTPVSELDSQLLLVQFKESVSENRGHRMQPSRLHRETLVRRFLDAIHEGKVHFDDLGVADLDIIFPPVVEVHQAAEARNTRVGLACRKSLGSLNKSSDAGTDGTPWVPRHGSPAPPLPPKAQGPRGPPPRPPLRPPPCAPHGGSHLARLIDNTSHDCNISFV